jgi:hypothetical protein
LDAIAHITSTYGLVSPGTIATNEVSQQSTFQAQENVAISNGTHDVYFYPNFKAGTDNIHIEIPGIPTITIPIHIATSSAQKILIQTDKDNYFPQEQSKGKISVFDYRNNRIQTPTDIKVGVIGPGTINGQDTSEILWTGNDISFSFATKTNGGE